MKTFEMWNTNYEKEERISNRIGRIVGWRAALEWVQKTVKELDEQDAPICMDDVIKQELEDK